MANLSAKNKVGSKPLVFGIAGGDTPVVWSYVCPVDSHLVVSGQRLQYDSSGSATGVTPICPTHAVNLSAATAKTVS